MQSSQIGAPLDRMAVDVLGPLPETEGFRYILVVGCYFTKWHEAIPMADATSKTIVRAMVDHVFTRLGVPRTLHSDRGTDFESKLFKEMCELLQIRKTRTSAYHPQSDGMIERFKETGSNWCQYLQVTMMAYRSAVHTVTGMTPNEMMLGREITFSGGPRFWSQGLALGGGRARTLRG